MTLCAYVRYCAVTKSMNLNFISRAALVHAIRGLLVHTKVYTGPQAPGEELLQSRL